MRIVIIVPFLNDWILAVSCVMASIHRSEVVTHSVKIVDVSLVFWRLHLILLITFFTCLIIVEIGLS